MKHTLQLPSFKAALRFWCKLGWINFGGTAAHIAICMTSWSRTSGGSVTELSHCMILPGPEAQQPAIYIGWKLHSSGVALLPEHFLCCLPF